ncbi:MAG: transcription initiation factor IIB [Candidatus Woesearchaeota archaeon]
MSGKSIKKCPECGSHNLFFDMKKGEVVCRDCGFVIDAQMVDFDKEWRSFEDEENEKRRAGSPLTYTQYDKGVGTQIGNTSDFARLDPKLKKTFQRISVWHQRVSTAIERNLKTALAELRRISSTLNLPPSVEEEAARIYTLAVQKGLVRGRSMESVVSGAVYAACRRNEVPRTLNEISESIGIDKKEIGRTYRFITRELGINILPSNPADYIDRFASALKLSSKIRVQAIEILEKAKDLELTSGRGPTGIAAAALYVAALMNNEKRTQREVAEVAGVTEVTIRNRYKELIELLKLNNKIKKSKKRGRKEEQQSEDEDLNF